MSANCKIFTPKEYVIELLEAAKYTGKLYGKSVLENSCGDGFILMEVVKRYIKSCRKENLDDITIINGLENDICGIELEESHAAKCINNLKLVASQFGIYDVKWNIITANYLLLDIKRQFNYIFGNPPYIVYRDIDISERSMLKEKFEVCREGKFDYYYAFVEKGFNDLLANGLMAYIIPTSIYKNVFAQNLREYIKPYIYELHDYTYKTKFPGITTSSTIMVLQNKKFKTLIYKDVMNNITKKINKLNLVGKWNFSIELPNKGKIRFGDYFEVSNTIATLCNKAYILEDYSQDENYYYVKGMKIERDLVYRAISKRRGKRAYDIKIIFPYYYNNKCLERYGVDEFETKFPYAKIYLKQFEEDLINRKADNSAKWFEYGRSQALSKMRLRKLVIPSILSSKVQASIIEENVVPCAGFIIIEKGNIPLEKAKFILESTNFFKYLDAIGIFTTGKSRRLSVKDIGNYRFDEWEE